MKITFESITTDNQIEYLEQLACTIWNEAFITIVSKQQIDYMLEKYQSFNAISKAIKENNYKYFFIKYNNNIVGYTGLHAETQKLFLSKFYILQEYRGKHIATKAFEFVEQFAKENNLKSIYLTTNKRNYHAIDVYKHRGFVVAKEQTSNIGNGFVMDDYVFEKEIN